MTVTISPTLTDVFTTLRAFLIDIIGSGVEVIQTQDDRVGEPTTKEYITMTPVRFPRLGTDVEGLDNTGLQAVLSQPQEFVMQLDIHGETSYESASRITTMFRSSYAVDFFASLNAAIAPLYHGDAHQMPFLNAEQGYENRYTLDLSMQVNLTATVVAQSATTLTVGITDVETNSASWPNSTASASAP